MCKCNAHGNCDCPTPLPADWAIERALKIGGCTSEYFTVAWVKRYRSRSILGFAQYIETHEEPPKPPTPPELIAAREFGAGHTTIASEAWRREEIRKRWMGGERDQSELIQAFLAGVAWARENVS